MIGLTPGVDEGSDLASAIYDTDEAADPLPLLTDDLGNLGLLAGQDGNVGFTPSQAAEVVPTIAEYEQWEADIASILATGGTDSMVAGDMALLTTIEGRLEAVTTAMIDLFGGAGQLAFHPANSDPPAVDQPFYADAQGTSGGGETITPAEQAQLLATTLPSGVTTADANAFIDRWNLTVQYWTAGIVTASQVPLGQSTDFIDAGALATAFAAAENAELASQADGYSDVAAEYRADLLTVQNSLADEGVCATVVLRIDQTATLTRSAFSGTLSITNSEGTGAMTNVAMDITITDSSGNPANGEFYISSPTYSGSFINVVNGTATLPDNSTGTITFTFIPDDSAATGTATIYDIGGTIGFTDPSGGN